MAKTRWIAAAPLTQQVETLTVGGTPALGQTYTVTMGLNNAVTVSYTATGTDTNATIAAGLQAALAASAYPQVAEITWTVNSNVITATAKEAGTPFTLTPSASGTGSLTQATVTANSSPSDLGNAANYSLNALPATGDDLYFDFSSVDVLWNLTALSAVTLNSLNVPASYTGNIGLPEVNTSGSTPYEEYRPTHLAIGATTINIGDGDGTGSQRIKLDSGAVQTALVVRQLGQSQEDNLEALQWKGTHISNTVEVLRGTVGIAGYGGETATVATLTVGSVANEASNATVRCGAGTTLTTINQNGGTLTINSAVTTLNKTAGTLNVYGTGAVGTLTDDSGETTYYGTGTLTTLSVGSTTTFTVPDDKQARTVSTCKVYKGATISDPAANVTWSSGIQLVRCRLTDVTLDVGYGRTLTPS